MEKGGRRGGEVLEMMGAHAANGGLQRLTLRDPKEPEGGRPQRSWDGLPFGFPRKIEERRDKIEGKGREKGEHVPSLGRVNPVRRRK